VPPNEQIENASGLRLVERDGRPVRVDNSPAISRQDYKAAARANVIVVASQHNSRKQQEGKEENGFCKWNVLGPAITVSGFYKLDFILRDFAGGFGLKLRLSTMEL